jgi:hypothetical protein
MSTTPQDNYEHRIKNLQTSIFLLLALIDRTSDPAQRIALWERVEIQHARLQEMRAKAAG